MVVENQTDSMFAGNHRLLNFTLVDQDNDDAVLDISLLDLKFTLARVSPSGNILVKHPVVEKKSTVVGEITKTDAPNGECQVVLVGDDTETLLGDFYFELEAFDSTSESVVLATGTMTIKPNVVNT